MLCQHSLLTFSGEENVKSLIPGVTNPYSLKIMIVSLIIGYLIPSNLVSSTITEQSR